MWHVCDICVTRKKLCQFVHCDHRDHFNMWHSVTKCDTEWPLYCHNGQNEEIVTPGHTCHTLLHHMSLGHISIILQILLFRKYVPMVIVISNSKHVYDMLGVWNLLEPVIKSTTIHHFLTGNEGFSFLFFSYFTNS